MKEQSLDCDAALLMRIERAGVVAWPSRETFDIDGWLWRYSFDGSQRANSVSTLSFHGPDVGTAIGEVEHRYRARGARARFQVSDVSVPAGLDRRLADRGYSINDPCLTLAKPIDGTASQPADVVYFDTPVADWFACYSSVITPERKRVAPQILAQVPKPRAFCAVQRDGHVIATALAVAHAYIVIAECVATLADARGSGAASRVMRGLEAWGAGQGCRLAALQALEHSAPAQALYKSLGYTCRGRYHMRIENAPAVC